MGKAGSRLARGTGIALLALIALCPLSHANEAEATGQGTPIGVTVSRISDELREQPGYGTGVLVTHVEPGSLAHQAGVVKGDVLVVVGSVTLRSVDDLPRAESRIERGHPISIVVSREDGRLVRMMKLEPSPAVRTEEAKTGMENMVRSAEERGAPPTGDASRAEVAVIPRVGTTDAEKAGVARFGLRCEDLNADLAAALGMPKGRGVLVLQVAEGGVAAACGVRAGDIVVRAGDQRIWGVEHLSNVVEDLSAPVALTLRRQGAERTVELRPPSAPSASVVAESQPKATPAEPSEALKALQNEVKMLRREVQKLRERVVSMTDEVY